MIKRKALNLPHLWRRRGRSFEILKATWPRDFFGYNNNFFGYNYILHKFLSTRYPPE
jgi:hypothetical protein